MISGRLVAVIIVAVALGAPLLAQEAVLFEEASSGILELAGQSRLKIEGFAGTVSVRAGKKGELRYSAATRTARRVEHPVALWLRGGTIIFRPVAGQENDELILEIALSEGLRVDVRKQGGKIQISGLLTEVTVNATDSAVDVVAVDGPVDVRVKGGTLRLENLGGGVTVDASGVDPILLRYVDGGASLVVRDSTVTAGRLSGTVDLDIVKSGLKISESRARLTGTATESRLRLFDVSGGVTLQLDGTTIDLNRCRGGARLDTDSAVTFQNLGGDLNVTGFGGAVEGQRVTGSVTIENRNAVVSLTNVGGTVELKGQGLEVRLADLAGKLTTALSGSTIEAENLKGGLDVTNDFGDVFFEGVEGASKIVNRNGSVRVTGLTGSLEIDAEGPEVHVGWDVVGVGRDSTISNEGGDVFVDFPITGGARIEAEATSIETVLPNIRVDGKTAHGLVGGIDKPTVTVRASGRLVLTRGGPDQ